MASTSVLNGATPDALGEREPKVYGSTTLSGIETSLRETFPEADSRSLQTDHDGEFGARLRDSVAYAGPILDPSARTRYSCAMHDVRGISTVSKVEVHVSDAHAREPWRWVPVVSPAVGAVVASMGPSGYRAGVGCLLSRVER